MIYFKDDDDGYLRWMRANFRGSVLALKSKSQATIHAASCSHLQDDSGAVLTKKAKLCASESGELRKWASESAVTVSTCSDC